MGAIFGSISGAISGTISGMISGTTFGTIFGTISGNFCVLWMVPELVGQFKKFRVDQFCQVELK